MDVHAFASALGDLATAFVFGGMAIFSFLVAPVAFKALGKEQASVLMRAAFPVYYRVMAIASAVAGASFAVASRQEEWALAVVAIGFVGLLYLLLPALEDARALRTDGNAKGAARFSRLHGLSVVVNLAQFVIVLAAMTGIL